MVVKLSEGIYAIPVVDEETDLFESLWPLDDGVNYNSYVVVGSEGAAVIDTVHVSKFSEFFDALGELVDPVDIKYVVVDHMEPDHASSLELLLNHAVRARSVISSTGARLFELPGKPLAVNDGDTLNLGDKTLHFIHTPWTHWPETMVTHVPEEDVVFTCDLFGAYGAYPRFEFKDWDEYLLEARRYYVTVLAKYARFVNSAVSKIRALNPKIIAPGHGVPYSGEQLEQMLDLYADWSSGHKEGRVLILYGSMYGTIHSKVDALVAALESKGVVVDALDLSREDWSYAMTFVLGADVIVVAYPTYESDVFPPVKYFLQTVGDKGLLAGKPVFVLSAYGWAPSDAKIRQLLETADLKRILSFGGKKKLSLDDIEQLAEDIIQLL
jgi:flavorubredoxin